MSMFNHVETTNLVINALFETDIERLSVTIKELIDTNNGLRHSNVAAIRYMGTCLPIKPQGLMLYQVPEAHPSILDTLEKWINDSSKVKADQKVLQQALFNLFEGCCSLNDARDTLPECVVSLVPALKELPRNKDPGHSLAHSPRLQQQYLESIIPKMELYASLRYFF